MKAVFVISVAAELAGMHPQTLRIYERKGLIDPFRTPGGTRRYSQDDIERLQLIQDLTSQGLNLEGVRRVIALQEENRQLKQKVNRLREQVTVTQEQARRLVREARQTTRHEIILRRDLLPSLGDQND